MGETGVKRGMFVCASQIDKDARSICSLTPPSMIHLPGLLPAAFQIRLSEALFAPLPLNVFIMTSCLTRDTFIFFPLGLLLNHSRET